MTCQIKHLRINAQQCHFGPPEETLKHIEFVHDMGFNCEQLFHTHSELYMAVFDRSVHGNLVKEYLNRCCSKNIAVILYMNCHILSPSQAEYYADWAAVNADGTYLKRYETYAGICLNSSWIEYFLDKLRELKGLNLLGIFFDGPSHSRCYCTRCQKKFTAAYGIAMEDATEKQLRDFTTATILNCKKLLYQTVKDVNPDWISYCNEPLLHGWFDATEMQEILGYDDMILTEGGFLFHGVPHDNSFIKTAVSTKIATAVSDGSKPAVIAMAGDQKPWSWLLHTATEIKLCYAAVLANGGSVWFGLHCSPTLLKGAAKSAVKELVTFDKKYDCLFSNSQNCSEVALFYSFDTAKYYKSSTVKSDFYDSSNATDDSYLGDYRLAFNGAAELLTHLKLPFEIITELNIDELSDYKVCIVPNAAFMTDDIINKFEKFVQQGGVLLADFEMGCYQPHAKHKSSDRLTHLLGINLLNSIKQYSNYDYFALISNYRLNELDLLPMSPLQLEWAAGSATVIGNACPALAGRYAGQPNAPTIPFISQHKYGDGVAYYIGGNFFETYAQFIHPSYRWLLKSILERHYQKSFQLIGAPDAVEFSVRRCDNAIMFAIINFSSAIRPIENVPALHNLKIKSQIKFNSIKSMTTGEMLQLDADGNIILPSVNEYEFILAEQLIE